MGMLKKMDSELREIIKELNMVEWEKDNCIERLLFWDEKKKELEEVRKEKEWLLIKEVSGVIDEMD